LEEEEEESEETARFADDAAGPSEDMETYLVVAAGG
jgi:hypothetical protein